MNPFLAMLTGDPFWSVSDAGKRALTAFRVEHPTDLADAPQALAYALSPTDLAAVRRIANNYLVAFFL